MEIYKIINNINGKIYIGQTVRTTEERYKEHCRHDKYPIDRAIKRYGKENFSVEIIVQADDIEELNRLEQEYIKKYNSMDKEKGYNICKGGNNTEGYRHSDESKEIMRRCKEGKYLAENNPFYGKQHTEEQKKKWSEARSGRKLTEEWKNNIARSNHKKVINLDTGVIYESVNAGAESCGALATHITRVCKGKRKRTAGYRWAYIE